MNDGFFYYIFIKKNANLFWFISGSKSPVEGIYLEKIIPNHIHYITYDGSITHPGCHETVTWVVLNRPMFISHHQVSITLFIVLLIFVQCSLVIIKWVLLSALFCWHLFHVSLWRHQVSITFCFHLFIFVPCFFKVPPRNLLILFIVYFIRPYF